MGDATPLMKQYLEIKSQHQDAILFFRVGDFYEMFYEDAQIASEILEIALTSRDKNKEEAVPLCGVPYHAATPYIAKLIRAGWKVAICEQMEDPKLARLQSGGGIVKREVVRVITPGTAIEPDLLEAKEPLYIASIFPADPKPAGSGNEDLADQVVGLAYLDLSTGEFRVTELHDPSRLSYELASIDPKELLLPVRMKDKASHWTSSGWSIQYLPDWHFAADLAGQFLCGHFGVHSLHGYGCSERPAAISAAGALLRYVMDNQKGSIRNITSLMWQSLEDHMVLDPVTQKNLELARSTMESLSTGRQKTKETTLLTVLDKTQTCMGARLLRSWLLRPLLDRQEIEKRLTAVEAFVEDFSARVDLRSRLSQIHDLERLIGRISLAAANARDLVMLKTSLKGLPELQKLTSACQAPAIQEMILQWDNLQDIYRMIDITIKDDPPLQLHDGGLIKEGVHPFLDEQRSIARDGKGWIAKLEVQERQRTGIDSLKVRYNQVFGYYIEITRANLHLVPQDYIRKQTLVNAERFITPELKTLEEKVLGAEAQIIELEYKLFEEIRLKITQEASRIQTMARLLALLDVLATLAEVAHTHQYVKPQVNEGQEIRIVDGRHPVLERHSSTDSFIPNDTLLDGAENRLLIITGPNMAGKSTYMRQVALIVLMAQMGSFVPAREATIGLVDRIFTRVGASDDLTSGRSTFMVEMNETANIVNHATSKSLILLDEIGRGTSTFDGISIAWAVAEYIHTRIKARTLFATHYHELTDLAAHHVDIKNLKAAVREWNDEIIFLRKIVEGGADRSYGVQVARLAGLPQQIIQRAKEVLAHLEPQISRVIPAEPSQQTQQPDLFENPPSQTLLEEIADLDLVKMTPLEALNTLDELKKKAQVFIDPKKD
jgi:DNA mismatch repair protein MutS